MKISENKVVFRVIKWKNLYSEFFCRITWTPFLLGIFIWGCQKHQGFVVPDPQVVSRDDIPAEVWFSPKLWNILINYMQKSDLDGGGKHDGAEGGSNGHDQEKDASAEHGSPNTQKESKSNKQQASVDLFENQQKFLFSKVNLFFNEKNEGVLKSPSFRIEFSKGGGNLDLANFTGKHNGTFYLGFEFPEWEDATDLKIYFVSRYKRRRISGKVYGAGCNKILDITSTFKFHMKQSGIIVNTTTDRHLNVVGGSFIFASKKNKETFLTQVTIYDSRKTHLTCEGDQGLVESDTNIKNTE